MNSWKIWIKEIFGLLFLSIFILTSCSTISNLSIAVSSTPAGSPFLPPTGKEASISVADQETDGRTIKIDQVVSNGPGWLVVQNQNDGQPGTVIGYTQVHDGMNMDVQVRTDPELMTDPLYVELHIDVGEPGTYEFPGPDVPEQVNGQVVARSFHVKMEMASMPTPAPFILASQAPATAMAAISPGGTKTPTAAATSRPGVTPIVSVKDQDASGGKVLVQEVISNGPGWMVIFTEQDGRPMNVIGHAPVKDGINNNVVVEIDASKITPGLYAILHTDAGKAGIFQYPGKDIPVLTENGVVLDRFNSSLAEAAGTTPTAVALASPQATAADAAADAATPHVTASDQPLRGRTIKVAEAVSKGPGWLGIHRTSPTGEIGSAIGAAVLKDGLNKGVIVQIDPTRATPVMVAMVHMDGGQIGVWEFPGPDAPLMVNGQMVMTSFRVTEGLFEQDNLLHVSSGEQPYLVDGQGMALYVSLNDLPNTSTCDATCHKTWLPLLLTNGVKAGDKLDPGKLGFAVLTNGDKQVTYKGQPLYYYSGDSAPGDTKGQGIDGKWVLAAP